ncbi:MAG TPA: pyruvate kinase [Candidatus Saccharimonadales bacterium]|nr:pyruvate kinase [Candidatus Saccharimonadales bacterium]
MIYKRTKILATLGPSTNNYDSIEELILSGVNGFRLNFSHATPEQADQLIPWIRQASQKVGKPVAILQDLQGPKIRLGLLNDEVKVKSGDELILEYGTEHHDNVLPIQYDLSAKVKKGQPIFLFDGKVHSQVVKVEGKAITIKIKNDGVLMSRKGLNLPDTDFGGDIITKKDLADIEYGAKADIDYVALSFVQTAADIEDLKARLKKLGSTAKVIAKIETKSAIEPDNLEAIVKVSHGVMVARGDLAVEAGAEVVPIVQRDIIGLCQKYGKLSIVATQMMASMVNNPDPTRAEVSDVSHAVITGADCVMLSDETANGKYPMETVQAMKKVILYSQEKAPVRPIYFKEDCALDKSDAISSAAVTLAAQLPAEAIVAETKTGSTAFSIASHRPSLPIISVTSSARAAQQLALLYANKSFLRPDGEKAGFTLAQELRQRDFFSEPTTIVLVSGRQPGVAGATDTIRVRYLE